MKRGKDDEKKLISFFVIIVLNVLFQFFVAFLKFIKEKKEREDNDNDMYGVYFMPNIILIHCLFSNLSHYI